MKSVYGNQYYLVGINNATRATKLLVLRDKSTTELFPTISQIIAEFERETGVKVVYIRADNRKGEFGYTFQDRVKL